MISNYFLSRVLEAEQRYFGGYFDDVTAITLAAPERPSMIRRAVEVAAVGTATVVVVL